LEQSKTDGLDSSDLRYRQSAVEYEECKQVGTDPNTMAQAKADMYSRYLESSNFSMHLFGANGYADMHRLSAPFQLWVGNVDRRIRRATGVSELKAVPWTETEIREVIRTKNDELRKTVNYGPVAEKFFETEYPGRLTDPPIDAAFTPSDIMTNGNQMINVEDVSPSETEKRLSNEEANVLSAIARATNFLTSRGKNKTLRDDTTVNRSKSARKRQADQTGRPAKRPCAREDPFEADAMVPYH
jgi:hypothetical protein